MAPDVAANKGGVPGTSWELQKCKPAAVQQRNGLMKELLDKHPRHGRGDSAPPFRVETVIFLPLYPRCLAHIKSLINAFD